MEYNNIYIVINNLYLSKTVHNILYTPFFV